MEKSCSLQKKSPTNIFQLLKRSNLLLFYVLIHLHLDIFEVRWNNQYLGHFVNYLLIFNWVDKKISLYRWTQGGISTFQTGLEHGIRRASPGPVTWARGWGHAGGGDSCWPGRTGRQLRGCRYYYFVSGLIGATEAPRAGRLFSWKLVRIKSSGCDPLCRTEVDKHGGSRSHTSPRGKKSRAACGCRNSTVRHKDMVSNSKADSQRVEIRLIVNYITHILYYKYSVWPEQFI